MIFIVTVSGKTTRGIQGGGVLGWWWWEGSGEEALEKNKRYKALVKNHKKSQEEYPQEFSLDTGATRCYQGKVRQLFGAEESLSSTLQGVLIGAVETGVNNQPQRRGGREASGENSEVTKTHTGNGSGKHQNKTQKHHMK